MYVDGLKSIRPEFVIDHSFAVNQEGSVRTNSPLRLMSGNEMLWE
jgi:hypothetical protein